MHEINCTAYDIFSFNKLEVNNSTFSLLNFNIQSIRNKFSHFEYFLNTFSNPFDVICLTETWLNDDEIQFFKLEGYDFVGSQRLGRGGGVGAYVRCGLGADTKAVSLSGADVLSLVLHSQASKSSHFRLTVIYRQPGASSTDAFLSDLEAYISHDSSPHIVVGDINIDTLDMNVSDTYSTTISTYAFYNAITLPTRISSSRASCLDHILLNFSCINGKSGTIESDLSDHLPTFVTFQLNCSNRTNIVSDDMYRTINYSKLVSKINSFCWLKLFDDSQNCEVNYDIFITRLKFLIESCSQTIENNRPSKKFAQKPWITEHLLTQIKKKYALHKRVKKAPLNKKILKRYNAFRNNLNADLRTAKYDYFKAFISNCNSSQLWVLINEQTGKAKLNKRCFSSKLYSIEDSETMLDSNMDIANNFNLYFSTIAQKLASNFTNSNSDTYSMLTNITKEEFHLKKTDESQIIEIIEKLDSKKAIGLDNIPTKLIKFCKISLSTPLAYLFNKSIEEKIVPAQIKTAKILPFYKKGSHDRCENYRPISILPIFSKILEKIVNNQILNFLESKNLISKNQYGFRKNLSTADAVVKFKNNTLEAFNNGNCVLGIFIDFSKAFDTINHNILLAKMRKLGFSESTVSWVANYLSNRSHSTLVNATLSSSRSVTCGVPQGSVLGPTLFLIYINDLAQQFKLFNPIFYADDTNLFFESKDLNSHLEAINQDLNSLSIWCNKNKLTINYEKCNYIVLKNYQNPFQILENCILLNKRPINYSNSITFLGVQIDKNLNWSLHISNLLTKLRPLSGLIYRCSEYLPQKILLLIYNSFINSKLNYCAEAWGNAANTHLNKIFIFQKKVMRIMNKKPFDYPSAPLFTKHKVLSIYQIYRFKVLKKAHSFFYSDNFFPTHSINTRQSFINLPLPHSQTAAGHRRNCYQEVALWNELPIPLRSISNPNEFGRKLRLYLLE